jgi:hypothetical protein
MTPRQLKTLGELLYGRRWKTYLASDLGVDRRTVMCWIQKEWIMPAVPAVPEHDMPCHRSGRQVSLHRPAPRIGPVPATLRRGSLTSVAPQQAAGAKPKDRRYSPSECRLRHVTQMTDDQSPARVRGIGPGSPKGNRHEDVDVIPDWIIAVLAMLVVAGVFKLFGGFGVLAFGIIATAIWIAQIVRMFRSSPAQRIAATSSTMKGSEGRHAAP